MNFRYRIMQFMQGRYGADNTMLVLFGIAAVIAIINSFVRNVFLQIIVYLIVIVALLRFFSKNTNARIKENNIVTGFLTKFGNKYKTYKTRKADKMHIYKKCPKCGAVLRLPRRKGKHKTVCPNCNNEFSVRVYKEY